MEEKIFESEMFLIAFLTCIPLFPLSKSKQFLVELKSGESKIVGTNNGNGTTGPQQGLSFQKNEAVKDISKMKPDLKKVENAESTTESQLTTTNEI